jgi:hypothetical protein
LNPPSFRQTPSSFIYEVYTSTGYLIERKSGGLKVTDTIPGYLS